jgi:hypothetical protein
MFGAGSFIVSGQLELLHHHLPSTFKLVLANLISRVCYKYFFYGFYEDDFDYLEDWAG